MIKAVSSFLGSTDPELRRAAKEAFMSIAARGDVATMSEAIQLLRGAHMRHTGIELLCRASKSGNEGSIYLLEPFLNVYYGSSTSATIERARRLLDVVSRGELPDIINRGELPELICSLQTVMHE